MSSGSAGTDWSDEEIDLIVADYFEMLRLSWQGQPFVKAVHNRELQRLTGRSRSSIEFKHHNISAVMEILEVPWLKGYVPRANFQRALLEAVEKRLDAMPDLLMPTVSKPELAAPPSIFFDAPPSPSAPRTRLPAMAERLVRKFDPAARDQRNRELGQLGEQIIFNFERERLRSEGAAELAEQVKWVSRDEGDGAGFDIRSFNRKGEERLLEVKTTAGRVRAPFYLSENERQLSEEKPDSFRLVRVYQATTTPRAFRLKPPLAEHVTLSPTNWRANF